MFRASANVEAYRQVFGSMATLIQNRLCESVLPGAFFLNILGLKAAIGRSLMQPTQARTEG
jgi:hypothetical protein